VAPAARADGIVSSSAAGCTDLELVVQQVAEAAGGRPLVGPYVW
jgi:hypothetical protein